MKLISDGVQSLKRQGEPHKESNFSISACEYAAPTTRLDSRVVFFGPFAGVALRQNCAPDLLVNQHAGDRRSPATRCYTYSDLSTFSQRTNSQLGI